MMNMILAVIIVLLAILAIINRKSKKICFALFAIMFILMGFNLGNADYSMYAKLYVKYGSSINFNNTEILFQLFCKVCYHFNLNYNTFLMIYSFFGISLMYITVRKCSKNMALVALLYFIFSFFLDAVQIRHFMASAIICYGLTFLIKEKTSNKDIFKYLLLNIIATGFHFISICYLIFLLIPFLKKREMNNILIKTTMITCMMSILLNSSLFIKFLSFFLPQSKIDAYFISGQWKVNTLVTLILIFIQLLPLIILLISKQISKKTSIEGKQMLNNMIIVNALLMLIIPLYFYTVEFGRVFRGVILLNYICLTNIIRKYSYKNDFLILMLSILLSFILFLVLIVVVGLIDKTVLSILLNNSIFN